MKPRRPDHDPDEPAFDGRHRRRQFDRDGVRLLLLRLIADEPRHGYDLIRAVETLSGGAYAPSPGVVYPILTLLADMGLVEEGVGPEQSQRRTFHATADGLRALETQAAETAIALERLQSLATREEHPVRAAFHRLREVARGRLHDDPDNTELAQCIIAILDETAERVAGLKSKET
ncbi:PadR family transcriptional regulator [Phenylobacterium immobile]|uniref:PadR family transcriptional regulator n=1 Tax=Phenylobacterium immobile TaxID=21 RepID=UPI000A73B8B8|nr:PadR family transcriptional regulator [Phenylobacterium immobile]